jgi:hypothetical protein
MLLYEERRISGWLQFLVVQQHGPLEHAWLAIAGFPNPGPEQADMHRLDAKNDAVLAFGGADGAAVRRPSFDYCHRQPSFHCLKKA